MLYWQQTQTCVRSGDFLSNALEEVAATRFWHVGVWREVVLHDRALHDVIYGGAQIFRNAPKLGHKQNNPKGDLFLFSQANIFKKVYLI